VSDRLKAALSEYDSYIKPCPINNPNGRRAYTPDGKCINCGARSDQNCGLDATASYHLVQAVRQIVGEA